MKTLWICVLLAFTGCSYFKKAPTITNGQVTVTGPKDNGKPATLNTESNNETVLVPAGSTVKVTKTEATQQKPATEVTEFIPAKDTEWKKVENKVKADTGTIDTTLAVKKVEAAESRPLLYASIVAALAAGFFVWASYPTPALACGVASGVFFAAWKMTDLPQWFFAVGLVAAAIGVALYFGHERGEKSAKQP